MTHPFKLHGNVLVIGVAFAAWSGAGEVSGQEPEGRIEGIVLDDSGRPVAGATIRFRQTGWTLETNGDGRFAIVGLEAGTYRFDVTSNGMHLRTVVLALPDAPVPPITMRIRAVPRGDGRWEPIYALVVDARTGRPLSGVRVHVENTPAGTTGEDGTFSAARQREAGESVALRFARLGFGPTAMRIDTEPAEEIHLVAALTAEPTLLPAVGVEALPARGKLAPFYERRASGLGRYLGPEEIADIPATNVTDYLATMPGVLVAHGGVAIRRAGPACGGEPPTIFLDGIPFGLLNLGIDDWVETLDVAAIEVYSGPARAPLQYNRDAQCGVILLWTN